MGLFRFLASTNLQVFHLCRTMGHGSSPLFCNGLRVFGEVQQQLHY